MGRATPRRVVRCRRRGQATECARPSCLNTAPRTTADGSHIPAAPAAGTLRAFRPSVAFRPSGTSDCRSRFVLGENRPTRVAQLAQSFTVQPSALLVLVVPDLRRPKLRLVAVGVEKPGASAVLVVPGTMHGSMPLSPSCAGSAARSSTRKLIITSNGNHASSPSATSRAVLPPSSARSTACPTATRRRCGRTL